MPKDIIMPALSAGMEDGHLVRWLKREGDLVRRGDMLAEIETDKAVMEMEAEADGRLGPLLVTDGARQVAVGTVIGSLLAPGEVAAPSAPSAPRPQVAAQPQPVPPPVSPAAPVPVPVRAPHLGPVMPASGSTQSLDALIAARKVAASPLAARLARAYGLDLARVSGSGPKGRIVRLDVERARSLAPDPIAVHAPSRAGTPSSCMLHHAWLRQGEGRPLVLVHGFGSDLNGWRPFLQGAQLARPVLGLDLPGHGGSVSHPGCSFADLVEAVDQTLEALGLGAFDLVAHSLGAAVSARLAGEGRHDVRSLFLLAPAGLGPEVNAGFVSGFARARSVESLQPWMAELVADPARLTPAFVKASAAARADDALVAAQQRLAGRLFPDGVQAFGVRDALESLQIPATVLFGELDRIIPPHQARRLPGLVALHLFAGVGHMPQLEIRESVWRVLHRHLRAAS